MKVFERSEPSLTQIRIKLKTNTLSLLTRSSHSLLFFFDGWVEAGNNDVDEACSETSGFPFKALWCRSSVYHHFRSARRSYCLKRLKANPSSLFPYSCVQISSSLCSFRSPFFCSLSDNDELSLCNVFSDEGLCALLRWWRETRRFRWVSLEKTIEELQRVEFSNRNNCSIRLKSLLWSLFRQV